MLVTFYHLTNPTLWQFWANFKTSPLQSSPFRRIKKINLTLKLQLQSLHFSIPAIHVLLLKYFNESKNFVLVPSVLESSLPLCGRLKHFIGQLMTANDKCQCVHWLRHDRLSGQFSKYSGLSASISLPFFSTPFPFLFSCHFLRGLWLSFLVLCS